MHHAKRSRRGLVLVAHYRVEWDKVDPVSLKELAEYAYERLEAVDRATRLVYSNPAYKLTAPADSDLGAFIHEARRARALWTMEMICVMSRSGHRRAPKRVDACARDLIFHGLLYAGMHRVHHARWPSAAGAVVAIRPRK